MMGKLGISKLLMIMGLSLGISTSIGVAIHVNAANGSTQVTLASKQSKFKLNRTTVTVGEGYTVDAKALNATGKVTYKSSDEKVATVDDKGIITARVSGKATITAECGGVKTSCIVNVKKVEKTSISVWSGFMNIENNASFAYPFVPNIEKDVYFVNARELLLTYKNLGYKADGIYAAVHSEDPIRLDGVDEKGNVVGSYTGKGDFVVNIPGATDFILNNAKKDCLVKLYPTLPTIIKEEGTYQYSDFTWTKMKDSSLQADYIVTLKGAFVNVQGTGVRCYSAGYNILKEEITDAFTGASHDAFLAGGFRIEGQSKESTSSIVKLNVTATQDYYNSNSLRVYGIKGLDLKQSYYSDILDMMDRIKLVGKKLYYPSGLKLRDKITLGCKNINTWTGESAIFTTVENLNLKDNKQYLITSSNIANYYFQSQRTYAQLIEKWLFGMSAAIAEDVMREKGLLKETESMYDKSALFLIDSHSSKDIEKFFVEDTYQMTENETVGYFFIRFLQKNYGKNIVKTINESLLKEIERPTTYWHNAESDKKWISCVKKNTEEKVFERFRNEVLLGD